MRLGMSTTKLHSCGKSEVYLLYAISALLSELRGFLTPLILHLFFSLSDEGGLGRKGDIALLTSFVACYYNS